ncbi:hypothetical protein B9J07_27910 [Sinorhizobium sp. LM21]|uniref:hypothetical protein n=1 Tax=Sinorhizobium sp. LM21 TaxID=1449788 RepID=UPI000B5B5362|nr:hypothetical protein [Sinorhizobium sp. LM21]OWZ90415.1 hypothetical protein B9J07_27910 [Sinorhizobium sp. LM21]
MKQVRNETAVYHLAVALRDYDNCNPDVGMGWPDRHFIDQAAKQLGLTAADFDANHVTDLMRSARR